MTSDNWNEFLLKGRIEVQSGYPFKTEQFIEKGIPIVKIGNIVDYKTIKTNDDSFVDVSLLEQLKDYRLSYNDVLIAMSGNTTAKMGRVTKDFEPSFVNQRVGWIKPISDEIDIDFIFYLLTSENYQRRLWNAATATGQPNLSPRDIKRLKFYKPPLSEQRKIASILTKVDDAIQAVKNTIEKAERLKKSLMQNLLTGKLKPDGSWRTEDEFYIDEKFGKVPVGWEVKRIEILIDRKNIQFDPLKNEPINYVGLEHIVPNEFRRDGIGKSNETVSLKLLFSKGDLLFGKLRPYLNKVWLADTDGVCSTDFIVFHKGANTLWCYFNFQTKRFLNFTQSITAGTQHPRASYRDIKKYSIALPIDVLEKTEIERKISSLENIKEIKKAKIQKLERLKKALMQNLLTGKVRVKV